MTHQLQKRRSGIFETFDSGPTLEGTIDSEAEKKIISEEFAILLVAFVAAKFSMMPMSKRNGAKISVTPSKSSKYDCIYLR